MQFDGNMLQRQISELNLSGVWKILASLVHWIKLVHNTAACQRMNASSHSLFQPAKQEHTVILTSLANLRYCCWSWICYKHTTNQVQKRVEHAESREGTRAPTKHKKNIVRRNKKKTTQEPHLFQPFHYCLSDWDIFSFQVACFWVASMSRSKDATSTSICALSFEAIKAWQVVRSTILREVTPLAVCTISTVKYE